MLVVGDQEATVEEIKEGVVEEALVNLPNLGKLRGTIDVARDGKTSFFQFLGVPYAAPPVGELRFRPPAPPQAWEGVRYAGNTGPSCLQRPYQVPGTILGKEDCLYLNVFSRSLDTEAKKPVIVWIHGGSFTWGSGSAVKGTYMMEEDVVLVVIQYRLGPFGWLTTEDKTSPGNYGLHDQLAALRWIQDNIEYFGGDPNLVTISGLSAGGASVNYLMLSPNSDGLFHRAISMSGSALCWWANIPNQGRTAVRLGEAMGCPVDNSEDLVECLRQKPAMEIMEAQETLWSWRNDKVEREPMSIWSPRPDLEAGNTAVLPIPPHTAMEVGQIQPVPFLVGVAEYEGIWRAVSLISQDEAMIDFMAKFGEVAPLALGLVDQVNEGQMKPLVNKVKDYYLSALHEEKNLEERLNKVVTGLINMFGDTMFNYPIDRMVKLQGNKAHTPVWMYQYNYKHNHSLANFDASSGTGKITPPPLDALKLPTHGHELSMMFPQFIDIMGDLSEEETKQSKKFVKFIASFAKEGHPKQDEKYEFSQWKPVANGQLTHFVFGKYSGTQIGLPFQHRMRWWNDLPAFWKKDSAKQLPVDRSEDEVNNAEAEANADEPETCADCAEKFEPMQRYAESVEEISEDAELVPDELTSEELAEIESKLEELEVNKVVDQIKVEL